MIKHLVFIAALSACGSKASPPVTPKPADDPQPTASAREPAPAPTPIPTPTPEPAKVAEPAKPDPDKVKAEAIAAETAAYDKARPIFEKACASCHTKTGKKATAKKLGHFDMTTYPFGGEHAKSIGNEIRVVLAIDGSKKATMPDGKAAGSIKGDELATIKAWTEAWRAAGAAGAHPADPADKDDD